MSFLFDKAKEALRDVERTVKQSVGGGGDSEAQPQQADVHAHTHPTPECSDRDKHHMHRFQSFAPQREGNDAKWYVDGCSYMWAVSVALENARDTIWILDWWLSPELYLRRRGRDAVFCAKLCHAEGVRCVFCEWRFIVSKLLS